MRLRKLLAASLALVLAGCGGGGGSTPSNVAIEGHVVATGLNQPMQYASNPSHATIAYVIERGGALRVLVSDVLQTTPALDISGLLDTGGEGGLLGITFDPNFSSNRFFYLNYTSGSPMTTRVARYTMAADGLSASPGSAHLVFAWDQSPFTNHKGGAINFGADGLLYLGLGDGGSGDDPNNRAQDPQQLFGKILRIDPTGDDFPGDPDNNYHIPPSNPFVGQAGIRGEIWDVGIRNPFRWSFDKNTGALIIADVGQGAWEEFDYEPAGMGGRNYGWRIREGAHDTGNGGTPFSNTLLDPFLEVPHPAAEAIIGGFIYRGNLLGSQVHNQYIFGDYVTSKIWAVTITPSGGTAATVPFSSAVDLTSAINQGLSSGIDGPVSIDLDSNGEPIVVELNAGRVIRIVPKPVP